MRRWLLRRSATAGLTLLGIVFLDFLLLRLPAAGEPQDIASVQHMTAEQLEDHVRRYKELHHLDEPVHVQFGLWISGLARGDLGTSMSDHRPVGEKILDAISVSLPLQAIAIVIMFGLGIPLGVLMATRRDRLTDRLLTIVSFALYSIPSFFLATMLLTWFATENGWRLFPLEGLHSRDADTLGGWARLTDTLWHATLPVIVLSVAGVAVISRYMRNALLEVLDEDHVRTARAAGLPERVVVCKYAVRCALTPVVTLFGAMVPALVGGSVIVENIFNLDGVGRLLYSATFQLDYPVLQGLFLITATLTLAGYLISDVLQALVDPRVRLA